MNEGMDETEFRYQDETEPGLFTCDISDVWCTCMLRTCCQNRFSSPLGRFYCFSQWTPFWGAAGRTGSCRLALEPQKQGAKQEPLWLVQLILVDSSACSDNEATQAAVWCGQDRREHGWSVSLVGRGVGVWEPAPCPHSPGCPVSPAGSLRRRWAHPLLRGWAIQGLSRFSRTSES